MAALEQKLCADETGACSKQRLRQEWHVQHAVFVMDGTDKDLGWEAGAFAAAVLRVAGKTQDVGTGRGGSMASGQAATGRAEAVAVPTFWAFASDPSRGCCHRGIFSKNHPKLTTCSMLRFGSFLFVYFLWVPFGMVPKKTKRKPPFHLVSRI